MPTEIEWCEETWSPVTGCTPISAGCRNCYARRMANRLRGRFGYPADDPFRVTFHPGRLDKPLGWKKPRMIFVCSMGDLFHKDVDKWERDDIFSSMTRAPQHIYMVLTKRPEIMFDYFHMPKGQGKFKTRYGILDENPNIWLGVTAENQEEADRRIPILLQIPAAVHFVSVEPMLGAVDFSKGDGGLGYFKFVRDEPNRFSAKLRGLDWIICGAETGPGKRHMKTEWARDLRDQCAAASVPFFFKKDSNKNRLLNGKMYEEMPGVNDERDNI